MASGDDKAAQQAEHVAAPTTKVQCSIIPCQRGAVHTGRKAAGRSWPEAEWRILRVSAEKRPQPNSRSYRTS